MKQGAVPALALLAGLAAAHPAPAGEQGGWSREKCTRYARDWSEALKRFGTDRLGEPFIRSHVAFIEGGCVAQGSVCPRTAGDFEIANILTIRAMNFGAASTFLPFGCRAQ